MTSDGGLRERDGNVSLHEQVHRFELPLRIVRINEKLLEPLQLRRRDCSKPKVTRVWFLSGHEQTIAFRDIDLANLKTRLHEAARAQAQQLERGLRFEDDNFAPASSDSLVQPMISGRPRYSGNNFFSFIRTPRASTRKATSDAKGSEISFSLVIQAIGLRSTMWMSISAGNLPDDLHFIDLRQAPAMRSWT